MSPTAKVQEQRRHPRFSAQYLVILSEHQIPAGAANSGLSRADSRRYRICFSEDISEGGIKVWGSKEFDTRSTLHLEIYSRRLPDPVKMTGEVVRCQGDGIQPESYAAGLRFTGAPKEEKDRLRDLLAAVN